MFTQRFQSLRQFTRLNGLKTSCTTFIRTRNGILHQSISQRPFSLCIPSLLQRSLVQFEHSNVLTKTANIKSSSILFHRESSSTANDIDFDAKVAEGKAILEEYREKGVGVPTHVADDNLAYLFTLSKSKRGQYVSKLFKKEFDKQKKLQQKKSLANEDREENEVELTRILRRYSKQDYNAGDAWRVAAAMKFNPQIALDFVHDDLMNWREIRHLVTQVGHVLNSNKVARQPFHMHFVNYHYGGLVEQELKKLFSDQYENLLVSISDKGLCDVFQQKDIVYLSPDSNKVLTSYDPNKVYVIGALVDLNHETGATLSQAKQLSVEHRRLPLDMYLQWTTSHKSLTLDSVMNILIDQADDVDMATALQRHVPKRKFSGARTGVRQPHTSNQDTAFVSSRAKHTRKWNIDDEGDSATPRQSRHRQSEDEGDSATPRKSRRRQRRFDGW